MIEAESNTKQSGLGRKFETVRRIYDKAGLGGIRDVVLRKIYDRDLPIFGMWVEWTGNRVKVEGCVYDVNDPQVSRKLKGRLLTKTYERETLGVIRHAVDWELPLVELGAAIGVVSCICNRKLKDGTKHVVVEANPFLVPLLSAARAQNGCHFTILQRALGYGAGGKIKFYRDRESFVTSRLDAQTTEYIEAETVSLEEILQDFHFEKICLVCDIEGTEIALVENELETLTRHVKVLVMEWHDFSEGRKLREATVARLESAGFEPTYKEGWVSAFVNRGL